MPFPDHAAPIAAIFLLAGIVKGVTGMGLPLISIGLLSLVMPTASAAALVVVPSMVTNVWQFVGGPALRPLVRRLWPLLAAVCAGNFVPFLVTPGGWLVGAGHLAPALLGAALAAYAALGLSPIRLPRVPGAAEPWLGPIIGFLTGLVAAATGVFAIPAVPYLGSLGFNRDELVQALGLAFTISTIALALSLASALGPGSASLWWASAFALGPALLGMAAGTRIRRAVHPETFRRLFFLGILALGISLLARAVN